MWSPSDSPFLKKSVGSSYSAVHCSDLVITVSTHVIIFLQLFIGFSLPFFPWLTLQHNDSCAEVEFQIPSSDYPGISEA